MSEQEILEDRDVDTLFLFLFIISFSLISVRISVCTESRRYEKGYIWNSLLENLFLSSFSLFLRHFRFP